MSRAIKFDDLTIRQLFGSEDAESEEPERFKQYFYKNRAFDSLRANLPLRIAVGHKGVGKSALLRRSYQEDLERGELAVFVQPDDIATLLRSVPNADLNTQIELWKEGLANVIAAKAIGWLTEGLNPAPADGLAVRVGKRLAGFARNLAEAVSPAEVAAGKKAVYDSFLTDRTVSVYIDDVDRGWSARSADIANVSALVNALRDVSNQDSGLKCRLALRTDVYFLFRTSDESTDKIEQDVIRVEWNLEDILRLLATRVSTFLGLNYSTAAIQNMKQSELTINIFSKVMDERFEGAGKWDGAPIHIILASLCRKRPRDMIKLVHGAAHNAGRHGRSKIKTADFQSTFARYSEERLQDLFNEFKSEISNIDSLIMQFKTKASRSNHGSQFLFSTDQLITKLKNARQNVPIKFTSGRSVSERALLTFLFKIDFIVARFAHSEGQLWRFYEQGRFLAHEATDFGNMWEVHPAYRWALNPNNIQDIIDALPEMRGD